MAKLGNAGTGGSAVLDTTGGECFDVRDQDRTAGVTTFHVVADAGNTAAVLVQVHGLHDAGFEEPLAPGEEALYRVDHMAIRAVTVKAASGSQTVRWGARVRTNAAYKGHPNLPSAA